jgi:hypothetical protein
LAPGSALKKFAVIVNPEIKPTKVNWTLSWPSALEMCEETVFEIYKGLISGLILSGTVWTFNLSIALEKAYLSSLGSRIGPGQVCCNCEP